MAKLTPWGMWETKQQAKKLWKERELTEGEKLQEEIKDRSFYDTVGPPPKKKKKKK